MDFREVCVQLTTLCCSVEISKFFLWRISEYKYFRLCGFPAVFVQNKLCSCSQGLYKINQRLDLALGPRSSVFGASFCLSVLTNTSCQSKPKSPLEWWRMFYCGLRPNLKPEDNGMGKWTHPSKWLGCIGQ